MKFNFTVNVGRVRIDEETRHDFVFVHQRGNEHQERLNWKITGVYTSRSMWFCVRLHVCLTGSSSVGWRSLPKPIQVTVKLTEIDRGKESEKETRR